MFDKKAEPPKYMCSRCVHNEVCSLKERYIAAQKRIDNAVDDIYNIPDFVSPIVLQCAHYNFDIGHIKPR